jgi:hypothetical protein
MSTDAQITRRWKVRLTVRKGLLVTARARFKAASNSPSAAAAVKKRKEQVAEAERVIARHSPKAAPLRLRAWSQMRHLIDERVTEVGGNNRGRRVEEIIRANGGTPGEPWCGDTVAYCYLKAGAKSVVRSWASVRLLERLLMRLRIVQCGDVVTYIFDHTGLFKEWAPEKGSGYFWAGEGNTGNSGAASDSITGGDGVKLKLRHTSQVAGFWRVRS